MIVQYLLDIGGVILAAEREDESALLKIQQPTLERHVRIARILMAKGDAVEAILANDAATEGIVGIERDHLDLRELHSGAQSDHTPRKLVGRSRSKGEPCRVPEPRVEERIASHLCQDLIKVEEQRRFDAVTQTSPDLCFKRGPPHRLGALGQRVVA